MSASHVLDAFKSHLKLKNDAAVSRELEVAPPVISKLRHDRLKLCATMILRIHEKAPDVFPVKYIRDLMGD